jgi:prepilin-type N-terminal cleavage/methylation domain-containing protein
MLRAAGRRLRRAGTPADGFTLIEMLVAILIGVIITGALLAILEFSLRQTARISDRAQTDRIGRTAMSAMVEELRSSCTGFGATAIQAPSTTPTSPLASGNGSNLWFLSAYGNSTSGQAVISKLLQHDINWTETSKNSSGERLGTLTDYSFTGSGESPNWTFPTLSTTNATTAKVLAKNVIPPAGETTLFHYYKYDTTPTSSTYGELIEVGSSELPLTTTTAKTIAQVKIAFAQAPESGDSRPGHTTSLSGGVVLRFTGPELASEGTVCA